MFIFQLVFRPKAGIIEFQLFKDEKDHMAAKKNPIIPDPNNRPAFPKRAIITAGMPYGNKELHFGHVGGVFIYADILARFLRDRIGRNNVIFVSGTDGFGSPIVEAYEKLRDAGSFKGDINDFVAKNHERQKEILDAYHIDIDLFATSSSGRATEVHQEISNQLFLDLHKKGHLKKITTKQFYDPERDMFLNGRQVEGRCPILNCPSEKAYADECSLGHQFMPHELEHPKSKLTGQKPEMRDVSNWFIDLSQFRQLMLDWTDSLQQNQLGRNFYIRNIREFLEPPIIHVKKDQADALEEARPSLPQHTIPEGQSKAIRLEFNNLEDREEACLKLNAANIRFRTGKTLVPFRLTGNIDWGLPTPDMGDEEKLTWWCWPESLIAPMSFTATFLEQQGRDKEEWQDWWSDPDTKTYQIIGEDNVYFYGVAQTALFLGLQSDDLSKINIAPEKGEIQLTQLVANNHLLFLNKKASSSSQVKPPMAHELLDFYTTDQLRSHFIALGLGARSVSFKPKPLNPTATEKEGDPVLKEGNLLSNVLNRAIRSCFYTNQKYFDGKLPVGEVTPEIAQASEDAILVFEQLMFRREFHTAIATMDQYIRSISKYWNQHSKEAEQKDDAFRKQMLLDAFHMVKTATVLMHPIAPTGTEMVRDYFGVSETFWDWANVFEPLHKLVDNPTEHQLKFLEPRVDFFPKHPSQFG